MKKILILAGVIALTMSTQVFAADTSTVTTKEVQNPQRQVCPCQPKKLHKPPFDKDKFEQRLKLTDEQKAQAKQIREKGHEQMNPIMDQIRDKKAEIQAVRMSKLAPQAQDEKIDKIRKEIRELRRQANEIRMNNMKEFESILTKKQLKELNKMKEEGRKNFEKTHKKQLLRMPPMEPANPVELPLAPAVQK